MMLRKKVEPPTEEEAEMMEPNFSLINILSAKCYIFALSGICQGW